MIRMEHIEKKYKMGGEEIYALADVSLSIEKGEFVAIIGPSGSGKSTLMNIIGCLDTADSGSYALNGKPIEKYNQRQLAKIRNNHIGFIFQGFNLLSRLTALENVELPLVYQNMHVKERKERAIMALSQVGLTERMKHRPTQLSGGQQQRAAIARALAAQPALILADEPTGNLDQKTGHEILELFHRLHEAGNTIVIITHDPSVALTAQRVIHIEDGHVWEEGAAHDVPVV